MKALEIELSPALRNKLEHFVQLHDFYGTLLTERQNTCFAMHYLEDLSLSEIAAQLGITPQAVADQLKRTVKSLRRYEEKLGFIRSWQLRQNRLYLIKLSLDALIAEGHPLEQIVEMVSRCEDGF